MNKNKEEKIKIVNNLADCLAKSKNIYFTDIFGLNSEETSNLRRLCFNQGVNLSVVKNTLLKKAMDACEKDFSSFDDLASIIVDSSSNAVDVELFIASV